ncbi:MAG: hypothetical protein MUF26_06840, partial [Syntrophales bacterium]|nr:hypothetical protein [Syntrophales bacterium]
YYNDVTPWIDLKLAAISCHASQVSTVAYDEAVKGLNRYRGVLSGMGDYCEAFQVITGSTPARE